MIKSILIENFQKHKKTVLEFSNGLNVIRGESHNGKSAIIKAIRWVLQNKPSGSSFRRIGNNGADTRVCLEFEDGTVERIRGDKKNCYIFNNDEYRALRADVPTEIGYFLNINECCVQSQFDSHYLLSDSPGEVARTLNNIVGLEDIDKANKHVGRIIADANAKSKFLESELEKHEESLKRFEYLDVYEETLENIEKNFKLAEEHEEFISNIEVMITGILAIEEMFVQKFDKVLSIEDEVENLLEKQKEIMEIANLASSLEELLHSIELGNKGVKSRNSLIENENECSMLIKSTKDIENAWKDSSTLEELINNGENLTLNFEKFNSEITKSSSELKRVFDEQAVCPLCERSMK